MTKQPKKLYLIDGANYVYRAFYAIRNLSNSKGLPTGALYGFAQMLLKLLRDEKPDLVAVCFDTKERTFRDKMYEEYKANRKEPPDDLVEQFPYVRPLVEALGLPILEKPGFEADDVIGTAAKKFAAMNYDVVIVSGDKDLMQLIEPGVSILDEMKGLRIGPKEVKARFGVGPGAVVEILGLAGDASDNIPGVPGVGPKTAETLIQKYGTVENVIAHADELKGALAEKIKNNAEKARLSRRLALIETNVDIELDQAKLKIRGTDLPKARKLFAELEFSKLLAELAPQENLGRKKYRLVQDKKNLCDVIDKIKKSGRVSIDLETTSLDVMRAEIVGISLSWAAGEAAYVPIGHVSAHIKTEKGATADLFGGDFGLLDGQMRADDVFSLLKPVLADLKILKIGQNLNYDLTILILHGIKVAGIDFDTMLASYVLDPSSEHNLDSLAQKFLDHRTIHYEDVVGKGKDQKNFSEVSIEAACDYSSEDADVAFRLADVFAPRLEKEGLAELFHNIEMPMLHVLVDMQLAGVKVDTKKLGVLSADFSNRLSLLEKKIFELSGESFNVNSPRQLGAILFEKLGLKGGKKTKTGYSTSQDILEDLSAEHEIPKLILEYRSLSKLKGTYIDALPLLINPDTGRIHTSFNQAVTATGRLSSSEPNLQNIPNRTEEGRKIREAFVAEDGFVLLSADYSQIELRVLAHMSGDETLLEAFKRGDDVHAITASGIFGVAPDKIGHKERAVGKTVNFATIYGQTAYGLSRQLGIDVHEAAEYIDNYFKKYPRVSKYRDEIIERAKKEGKVETLFGRRRFFPDIASSNAMLSSLSERMAFNTVFQGTAADIIKRAMIMIHSELADISKGARMLVQVHDELLIEVPEKDAEPVKKFVSEKMEHAADLSVPLLVDVGIGKTWADAH